MFKKIKTKFYFVGARYFAFWARIVLRNWHPKIIVVTGSVGKTTIFYLLEAQLKEVAEFAYSANSAFGIPFDILKLSRKTYSFGEWFKLFFLAPFKIFVKNNRKEIYVVEADSDRPKEARFLADLLKPDLVLITNIFATHAVNFDELAAQNFGKPVIKVIAEEFSNFIQAAREAVLVNGDCRILVDTIEQMDLPIQKREEIVFLQEDDYLDEYNLNEKGSYFVVNKRRYQLPYLLPQAAALGLAMTQIVLKNLKIRQDESYKNLNFLPGRSSVFAGVKNTILIDSSYNANIGSMKAMLDLFDKYPAEASKLLVLGHMLEQGLQAQSEHENLAALIVNMKTIDKVYLIGANNKKWVLPLLEKFLGDRVTFFDQPILALNAIQNELKGGETLMFKGAPFMEEMVARLLADPQDEKYLVRREAVWHKRREKFYGQREK